MKLFNEAPRLFSCDMVSSPPSWSKIPAKQKRHSATSNAMARFSVKKHKPFLQKHKFAISILGILLVSLLLRTYNLQSRIGIGGDAGRDAMIGQVALMKGEFPMFGSFSSAGPFVFGPLFYWFNMLAYFVMPFTYQAPWYLMVAAGVATVGIMAYVGYLIGGKRLAIFVSLLVAFCPQFISRSTSLSQHSLIGITTACLLLFFILYYKKHSFKYAFFAGISLGSALSMHWQALNLFIFFPALLFVPKIKFIKKVFAVFIMFAGFMIPSLPILYWDSRQSFANLRNMLDYFLIVQYRMYVPSSWKLYLFKFLPDYWANVVGGSLPIAFFLMIFSGLTFIYSSVKKRIPGEMFILGIILGILLIVIRYYKGVRFEGYMIYTAPLIFIISAWTFTEAYDLIKTWFSKSIKKTRLKIFTFASIVFFAGILATDFDNAKQFIFAQSYYIREVERSVYDLKRNNPNTKFALYYYPFDISGHVYAFSLLLSANNLTDKRGKPVGITFGENLNKKARVVGQALSFPIVDLSKENVSKKWVPTNPEDVYDDLITRWTKKEKLKSPFSLDKFIMEKIGLDN